MFHFQFALLKNSSAQRMAAIASLSAGFATESRTVLTCRTKSLAMITALWFSPYPGSRNWWVLKNEIFLRTVGLKFMPLFLHYKANFKGPREETTGLSRSKPMLAEGILVSVLEGPEENNWLTFSMEQNDIPKFIQCLLYLRWCPYIRKIFSFFTRLFVTVSFVVFRSRSTFSRHNKSC